MQIRTLTTLVVLGFLFGAANTNAVLVDFDSNLEGFVSDPFDPGDTGPITHQATAGSGGDIGWAGVTIDTTNTTVGGPFPGLNKGTNADFAGDLLAKHGAGGGNTTLTLSVDFMLSQSMADFNGFGPRFITPGGGERDWIFDNFGAGPVTGGVWNTRSLTFDTTWSNLEATAAGWRQIQGGPFSEMVDNVNHFEMKYTRGGAQLPDGAVLGLDNFDIFPEPASLSLLAVGGLIMLRRRR